MTNKNPTIISKHFELQAWYFRLKIYLAAVESKQIKGQLISKCLFNSPKKQKTKIQLYYYCTSSRIVFIPFLGELKTPKRDFEIKWPLAPDLSEWWNYSLNIYTYIFFNLMETTQPKRHYIQLLWHWSSTTLYEGQIVQMSCIVVPTQLCSARWRFILFLDPLHVKSNFF